MGGFSLSGTYPFALRQRSGGDRPDHLGRQCRDAYGRREERLGQVVQERYGDRLRTGQLHHRRGIGQVCPYRQSQPHDRFRSASALYFRGGLHRRQRAGDSVPGGDSVHAAPERRSDDRRRGVCTRRHRIQERRGGDAQGALRPVARSLYRHDERHLRVGHQGFGGIRGHDTDRLPRQPEPRP